MSVQTQNKAAVTQQRDQDDNTGADAEQERLAAEAQRAETWLLCMSLACMHLDVPVDAGSLSSGFARQEDGSYSHEDAVAMLQRHHIASTWYAVKPSSLNIERCPAVVSLSGGQALVLLGFEDRQTAQVLRSDCTGVPDTMSVADLDAQALGPVLSLVRRDRALQRSLTPMQGSAAGWFWRSLMRFRRYYVEAFIATVFANLLTLAGSFFAMNVYDRVVPTEAYTTLTTLAVGTLVAITLEYILRWLKSRMLDIGSRKADLLISATLYREILSLRLEHRPPSVGSFASSMRDFESLRDFFSSTTMIALTELPFSLMFLGVIALVAGPVALVPAGMIVLMILVGLLAQPTMMRAATEHMRESAERHSVLVESLMNLEAIKANTAEAFMQKRWQNSTRMSNKSAENLRKASNSISGLSMTAQQLTNVGVVVFGVHLIHAGEMTMGALIAASILSGRALSVVQGIVGLASRYQGARTALQTLDGLMARPKELEPGRKYVPINRCRGALSLEEVNFAYPVEDAKPTLHNIQLDIPAASRMALLGRVGSGKSTLLRLLGGYYQPNTGLVTLDGVDMRQLEPNSLRQRIGFVGQETQLFYGTLRENLLLGQTHLSDQQLIDVLQKLDLYRLVASHPRGLDMVLSEGGGGLSGGQRQLLAIARMLLRNPSVVLMDEPTSAMDQNTEQKIINLLMRWLPGRTLILVTHRPQLLVWCERIAIIESGRLIADGPRAQMLQRLGATSATVPAAADTPQAAGA